MDVQVRAATDIGLRRPENEDRFGVWLPPDRGLRVQRGVLLVVADGMGGARAGEVASAMAVDRVLQLYGRGVGEPLDDLRRAFEAANRAVHAASLAQPDLHGMGTTLTALVVRGDEAFVAHVGDTRAYLVRDRTIVQLTADHSLVAQLVRERHLTAEEARVDPRRNVVTRSVGVAPEVLVDLLQPEQRMGAGDTLLLSSDGLHGLVSDEEIALSASAPVLDEVCGRLVALARQLGGHDNITVVAARLGD
jgi:protein phosphatase